MGFLQKMKVRNREKRYVTGLYSLLSVLLTFVPPPADLSLRLPGERCGRITLGGKEGGVMASPEGIR
jgi:hypothetical protein